MNEERARDLVLRAIGEVAPEADLEALDPALELADQLDLDSMDFLNFLLELERESGVSISERDYPKLSSVDACVAYVVAAAV